MSLIIFIGSNTNGYFAEEVAKIRGFDYVNIPAKGYIKEQTNDILFAAGGNKCEYLIYDVEQYIDSAETIADEILSVSKTINAKPIIYAPSFIPESAMARAMVDRDIKSFVLSGSPTDLKDQLEKNMTGFFDSNERKEIEQILQMQEEEKLRVQSFTTIGVAGACHRIGTTTQALQLVKYLQLKGYKVCLIELNSNKYIDKDVTKRSSLYISFVEKIKSWFAADKVDEELGMISCFGIDMYYKQDKIPDVLKKGYDYYVYDYGVYTEKDFNKTSFIRENLKLFVVGSAPTELDYTQEIAQNISYADAKLVFSLVAADEQEDILMLMNKIKIGNSAEGNGKRTYFADYTPDPFSFSNLKLYEKLLPVEDISEGSEDKKKKGFIGKFRKGGKKDGK